MKRITSRALILIVLSELIYCEELFKGLTKCAVFASRKGQIKGEGLLMCVTSVITFLAPYLRPSFTTKNLKQRRLRLVVNHMLSAWLFMETRIENCL